jgi:hypothetical protein
VHRKNKSGDTRAGVYNLFTCTVSWKLKTIKSVHDNTLVAFQVKSQKKQSGKERKAIVYAHVCYLDTFMEAEKNWKQKEEASYV